MIFDNVYAWTSIWALSQEQATQVLEEKAQAVYGAPLTIQLQDRTLVLTPEETKAQLDAAALAEAACRYGRDGNMFDGPGPAPAASLSTYTLEAADYLTLDTGYIQDAVNQLSADLESTLTQPEVTVEGQRPDLSAYPLSGSGEDEEDEEEEPAPVTPENGQVLTIYTGRRAAIWMRRLCTGKFWRRTPGAICPPFPRRMMRRSPRRWIWRTCSSSTV